MSDHRRPSHDELADLVKSASDRVPPGSRWRHRNGVEYVVFGVAVNESSLDPWVMYGDVTATRPFSWCRPLSEFLDGRFVRSDWPSSPVRVVESSP